MPTWIRMLAAVLVLWTGGVFEAAAAAFDAVDECGDEQQDCDCSTCVVPCGCCALRASVPFVPSPELKSTVVVVWSVFAPLDEPVVALSAADIFHPPKA